MNSFTLYSNQNPSPLVESILNEGAYLDLSENAEIDDWFNVWTDLNETVSAQSHLHRVYRWNYLQLTRGVHALANDTIASVADNATGEPPEIALNGYVMNMISSGSDLIKLARDLHNHLNKRGFSVLEKFELITSQELKDNFYFALLRELRNHAQHGQLLVSTYFNEDGLLKACFDLEQIKRARLIKKSKSVTEKIDAIIQQIYDSGGTVARLSFTHTIDAFHMNVLKLYICFLKALLPFASQQEEKAQGIIEAAREIIKESPDGTPYLPLMEGKTLHLVNADPKSLVNCIQNDLDRATQ